MRVSRKAHALVLVALVVASITGCGTQILQDNTSAGDTTPIESNVPDASNIPPDENSIPNANAALPVESVVPDTTVAVPVETTLPASAIVDENDLYLSKTEFIMALLYGNVSLWTEEMANVAGVEFCYTLMSSSDIDQAVANVIKLWEMKAPELEPIGFTSEIYAKAIAAISAYVCQDEVNRINAAG